MKLIIDIPENRFKDIQRIASVQLDSNHFQTGEQIIASGIPLEQIRDEIEREADYQDAYVNADIAKGMYLALEIIDKKMK